MRSSIILPLALAAAAVGVVATPTPFEYYQARLSAIEKPFRPEHHVKISLYVMSRCPDAALCESVFDAVLKAEGIIDKIDLRLEYFGEIDKEAPYGVDCMHGDIECAGNAHQLCVAAHTSLEQFYAVVSCMNYDFPGAIGTVALTRRCSETAGIDWWGSGVGRCVQGKHAAHDGRSAQRLAALTGKNQEVMPQLWDVEDEDAPLEHLGAEGKRRLHDSVARVHRAGVTKSCTIDITSTITHDKRRRCVVDSGVWKGCDDGHTAADFVRVIKKEWKALNPAPRIADKKIGGHGQRD